MIHYRDAAPDPARPGDGPFGPLFTLIAAHDPLSGPARHADPVAAMGEDVTDIVGARGCVEELDLLQRGWTQDEVARLLTDAIRHAQGRPIACAA